MYRNVVTEMSPDGNGLTEMSRDQNGPDRKRLRPKTAQTETAQTETARPNQPDRDGRPNRPDQKVLFRPGQ